MFTFLRYLTALLLACLMTAPPAHAEEEPDPGEMISVFGEGSARVENGDYIAARRKAVSEALHHALDAALATILTPEEMQLQQEYLRENIYKRGFDFVHKYRFLHDDLGPPSRDLTAEPEAETADGTPPGGDAGETHPPEDKPLPAWDAEPESNVWYASMEFTFFLTYLQNALASQGIEVSAGNRSTVVAIINEASLGVMQGPGFLVMPSSTEEKLAETVAKQGYKAYTRKEVRELNMEGKVLDALNGSTEDIRWLGGEYEAEYVILGTAHSRSHPATAFNRAYVEGVVEAAIYDGYSGRELWSETITERIDGGGAAAGFKAIRKAGSTLARRVTGFLATPTFNDRSP